MLEGNDFDMAKAVLYRATQPHSLADDDEINGWNVQRWRSDVLRDADLTPAQKLAACALAEVAKGNTRILWPTLDQLAARLGQRGNSKRLSEYLAAVEAAGYLQRVPNGDGPKWNWVYCLKYQYMPRIDEAILLIDAREGWTN